MHIDTLNAKYDADAQVKRLVWSMGKTFQKLSVNKKCFHIILKHSVVLSPSCLCVPDAEPATCIIVARCHSTLLNMALVQPFHPTR